ncbi:TlpA disulfide reductase family protein [Hyunsoonleella pacifica]|uniref:TlpA family protein disulfide reductase n=1 Tax=Hyunsoonleella pacifica TaxID=1080224 RepID=A0A4Q9FKK1_9FLAO|nr:TlpA disulfide reductase family protein [Hyunsoonleella pacifica]TBN13896.1 TlpA family protein disulfide reductase [Hyunsoonleella pacifica]
MRLLIIIVLVTFSCKEKVSTEGKPLTEVTKEVEIVSDINLEVYDFEEFKTFLNKTDDKTYVINFWATWCGPCVKELPYFEKLNTEYKKNGVEVILVSLDFPHVYESKLKPFIKKKDLKSRVIVLNDDNENKWINEIDKSWSGSIPATIIYNKSARKFFEKSFTYEELEQEVKQLK